MLLNLPPEIRNKIWELVLDRDSIEIAITSRTNEDIQNLMQYRKNPGFLLLVNKQIREETKYAFYPRSRLIVGNTARRSKQQPNIPGFRKWFRIVSKNDVALITNLSFHVELDQRQSHRGQLYFAKSGARIKSLLFISDAVKNHFLGLSHLDIRVYHEAISYRSDDQPLLRHSENGRALQTALLSLLPRGTFRSANIYSDPRGELTELARRFVVEEEANHPEAPISYTYIGIEARTGKEEVMVSRSRPADPALAA